MESTSKLCQGSSNQLLTFNFTNSHVRVMPPHAGGWINVCTKNCFVSGKFDILILMKLHPLCTELETSIATTFHGDDTCTCSYILNCGPFLYMRQKFRTSLYLHECNRVFVVNGLTDALIHPNQCNAQQTRYESCLDNLPNPTKMTSYFCN